LKDKLQKTYTGGIVSMHKEFRRKNSRKHFKEELFKSLTEWKYPSEDKKAIFEVVQDVFRVLKDANNQMLKKLCRSFQMIFPTKFDKIDPILIRTKLEELHKEALARTGVIEEEKE
jgi:hypothetical protein